MLTTPEECEAMVKVHSDHGGADRVLEVAGAKDSFRLAWRCARPNAIVTIVALYDEAQVLSLRQIELMKEKEMGTDLVERQSP